MCATNRSAAVCSSSATWGGQGHFATTTASGSSTATLKCTEHRFPGIFHIHENDGVEITGYLVVQALISIKRAAAGSTWIPCSPMLKWALEVQMKHLKNDMLPFNGDRTYIAGGFLPRYAMYMRQQRGDNAVPHRAQPVYRLYG